MTEAIIFNRMLFDLFGTDQTKFVPRIAMKNLLLVEASLQVLHCVGPGFLDRGDKPVVVNSEGLVMETTFGEMDELANAGARKILEGSYAERFVGWIYVALDLSGRRSEGLLVSSPEWDGTAFQFDSAKFGCFYTAVLRQRLVHGEGVQLEDTNCKVPRITSKIVPKGRRSFEVGRSIGQFAIMPLATIIPEYFATASVTKKHAIGSMTIVGSSDRHRVPGQSILEAASMETEALVYHIGGLCYVSTSIGVVRQCAAETQASDDNLEIDPLEMYEIDLGEIDELAQQTSLLRSS